MVMPRRIPNKVRRTFYRVRASCYDSARGDDGQGMVEYAPVLVLIAMVVIIVLQMLGQQVNNVFSNVNHGLAA